MEKNFVTSLDTRSYITTLILPIVLIGTLILMIMADADSKTEISYPLPFIVHGLIFIVYGFCYALRPTSYVVTSEKLTIKRLLGHLTFSLNDIEKAEIVKKEDMRFVMRTFGNGGIFGYTGKFYHSNFGNMTWYATRLSNYVLITLKSGKKIMLTPNDTALATAITSQLK